MTVATRFGMLQLDTEMGSQDAQGLQGRLLEVLLGEVQEASDRPVLEGAIADAHDAQEPQDQHALDEALEGL